ncbi:MAG: MAPEG family protein [Porticoccaceae bacterium]
MNAALSPTLYALTGFAGWTLILMLIMTTNRMLNSFGGPKIPMNKFSATGEDLPGFGQRVTRAHLNCLENLPVFAALVAATMLSGQFGVMENTAMYVLYARIAQSVVHLISASLPMVLVRGSFFFIQVVLMGWYACQLLF